MLEKMKTNNLNEDMIKVIEKYFTYKIENRQIQLNSVKDFINAFNEFCGWLQQVKDTDSVNLSDLNELESCDVQDYVNWLAKKFAPPTVTKRKSCVSDVLKYMTNYRHITRNSFNCSVDMPKRQQKLQVRYEPDDSMKMVEVADTILNKRGKSFPKQNKAMMALLCYGGLRRAEVAKFKTNSFTDNIDDDIIIIYGKGQLDGKPRVIPVMPELKEILLDYMYSEEFNEDSEFMFNRGYRGKEHIEKGTVYKLFCKCKKIVGCEHFVPHKTRYVFTEIMQDRGASFSDVKEAFAHSSDKTTYIYWQTNKIENAKKMAQKMRGEQNESV